MSGLERTRMTRPGVWLVAALLLLCGLVGLLATPLNAADDVSDSNLTVSRWYITDFGKFNLATISPLDESEESADSHGRECARFYSGLSRHSSYSTAVNVDCDTRVSLLCYDGAGALVDSLVYDSVEPGWYAVLVGAGRSMARLQVRLYGNENSREQVFRHE